MRDRGSPLRETGVGTLELCSGTGGLWRSLWGVLIRKNRGIMREFSAIVLYNPSSGPPFEFGSVHALVPLTGWYLKGRRNDLVVSAPILPQRSRSYFVLLGMALMRGGGLEFLHGPGRVISSLNFAARFFAGCGRQAHV